MPTVSTWLLPAPSWKPKGGPYPSPCKLTEEQAKARGAISIVPGTTEERQEVVHQSAGQDGVRADLRQASQRSADAAPQFLL